MKRVLRLSQAIREVSKFVDSDVVCHQRNGSTFKERYKVKLSLRTPLGLIGGAEV